MNLYKLHKKPETLDLHDEVHTKVPTFIWEKYKDNPEELKKREAAIATDPKCAYMYAQFVIKSRFPEGEAVIARDPGYSCAYAFGVIKGRFPEGEAAIARKPKLARSYEKAMGIKL